MYLLILEEVIRGTFVRIILFPLWWYSGGLFLVIKGIGHILARVHERLVPELWLRYLFVPMFGQVDWQGRMVSIVIRLLNAIVRGLILFVAALIALATIALWLGIPVLWFLYLKRGIR